MSIRAGLRSLGRLRVPRELRAGTLITAVNLGINK
jgi:hypothetical protein